MENKTPTRKKTVLVKDAPAGSGRYSRDAKVTPYPAIAVGS